jgi:hypothetical protein
MRHSVLPPVQHRYRQATNLGKEKLPIQDSVCRGGRLGSGLRHCTPAIPIHRGRLGTRQLSYRTNRLQMCIPNRFPSQAGPFRRLRRTRKTWEVARFCSSALAVLSPYHPIGGYPQILKPDFTTFLHKYVPTWSDFRSRFGVKRRAQEVPMWEVCSWAGLVPRNAVHRKPHEQRTSLAAESFSVAAPFRNARSSW